MQFKLPNMYVTFFPIYGLALGVNYWDTHMKPEDEPHEDTPEYMIQVFIFIFGISFHWWRD